VSFSHEKAVNPAFPAKRRGSISGFGTEVLFMKSLLLAILSLCFVVNVVALSPHVRNQSPGKVQAAAGAGLATMMGTVQDGDKLRFVTDQRAWNVDNPESLKGHEGHYVRVRAHVYSNRDSIHITEVNLPTATETRKDDMK
jgi:hypothetical protein